MTLDSLHEATKVPLELLREFEETGLFDHPMFNRVYLRSLIRAYADTVGISPKEALSALDLALAGTYNGELIRADEEPVQEAEAETATPPVEEKAAKADEGKAPEKAPPPATEAEPDVREKSPQTPPPSGKPQPKKKPDKPLRESRPAPETLSAADWETESGRTSSPTSKPIDLGRQTQLVQWGLIGLVVLVLGGAVWGVLALIGGGSDDDPVAATTTTDTTAVEDTITTASPEPEQPALTIGDTLNVVVMAETGKVQGIRITQDDDLRRPYWIEEGNSQAFTVRNRIVIEQSLENIKLLVEGYPYPTGRRDEQGRIVITRETVQAFADSLSGSPVSVDSTIVDRVPPPSPSSD